MAWGTFCEGLQAIDPIYDGDEPIWPLSTEEKRKLGAATEVYVKSLPADTRRVVRNVLDKRLPFFMLLFQVGQSIVPRAQFSFEEKRSRVRAKTVATAQARAGYPPRPGAPPQRPPEPGPVVGGAEEPVTQSPASSNGEVRAERDYGPSPVVKSLFNGPK